MPVQSSAYIDPQLPTLAAKPPDGPGWFHEIKHDGFRTQLHLDRARSRAFTRSGYDWSDRYAVVLQHARALVPGRAVLDGEIVVQDQHGRSDFAALRKALHSGRQHLVFYAFDLLEFGS